MENNQIYINTDGGSRGNPGPAAIGIVFSDINEKQIYGYKEYIGEATNNEAEYSAILKALEILAKSQWLVQNNASHNSVVCRLDSQLVVEQINGRFKIKQDHLRVFVDKIRGLISALKLNISFIYVPREQNKAADKLVNEALDAELR
ncbi:MAG: ribonuclease HI family protein [Candidatus Berkelbacteria bacterium]|nr:ribonuclease HI family protein [Candidatus Berkelbacteria bacterium]